MAFFPGCQAELKRHVVEENSCSARSSGTAHGTVMISTSNLTLSVPHSDAAKDASPLLAERQIRTAEQWPSVRSSYATLLPQQVSDAIHTVFRELPDPVGDARRFTDERIQ